MGCHKTTILSAPKRLLSQGKIIAHIPPNEKEKAGQPESENYDDDPFNDNLNDGGMFGERFVVQWNNGKTIKRDSPEHIGGPRGW